MHLRRRRAGTLVWLSPALAALGCSSAAPDGGGEPASTSEVATARPEPPATIARSVIHTGKVRRWPEATQYLRFATSGDVPTADMGAPRTSGLDAFWSIGSTNPGTGFFYADSIRGTDETRIAHPDVAHVSEIRDASALELVRDSVGPVPIGGIVVIEHAPSRRYLAIVVDAIEKTSDPHQAGAGPYAYADVTWHLTEPGQSDFGLAR